MVSNSRVCFFFRVVLTVFLLAVADFFMNNRLPNIWVDRHLFWLDIVWCFSWLRQTTGRMVELVTWNNDTGLNCRPAEIRFKTFEGISMSYPAK
jgi:hypothetical protein